MKTMMMSVMVASLLMPSTGRAQTVNPPAPSVPRAGNIPQPVEKTLPNGLRVVVVRKHDVPLVSVELAVKTGSESDPSGRAGLAQLTAAALTQGTNKRTAEQIAQGVEALGANLQADAGWDSSGVDVTVMSSKLQPALEYLADVARNATFAEDEVERLRQQALDSLRVAMGQPSSVATNVATRAVYGSHPYGSSVTGTIASVERLKRDDLVEFHRTYYRPDNAVLVFGGDVKPERAFELAQALFGGWRAAKRAPLQLATAADVAPPGSLSPRVIVIDMPDAGQAAVTVMKAGVSQKDALYFPAIVANSVLGGGYSSRLNQEIRIKRGLTYGAGSSFLARREPGPFVARVETKNESAAEVAGIIIDEMTRLSTADVALSELTPRRAVLIGSFASSLETSAGLVSRIATLAVYGQPLDEVNRYVASVQSVKPEALRAFAASHLGGETASVVIVGNAKAFLEPLKARFSNVEVIPIKELNLDSTTLR